MTTIAYYKITHRPTGKFYIGSSGNLNRRIWRHRTELAAGTHTNRKLMGSYTSWDDFDVDTFPVDSLDEARRMEQQLLDRYVGTDLCCNSSMSAINPFDVFERIPPSREISLKNLEKANEARRGKPLSDEHKARLSESHTGKSLSGPHRAALSVAKSGKVLADTHRRAISEGNKGKSRSDDYKRLVGELKSKRVSISGVIYPSLKAAAQAVGFSDVTIRKRINDPVNYSDWVYLD